MPETTTRKKILLVDDSEIIRIYFRDIFWIHGLDKKYELNICADIGKAKELIDNPKTRPDIVFSGLVMPMLVDGKMVTTAEAGFSLIKKIKSDPELKKIKVVIFSSYDEQKNRDQSIELGADAFLVKHENMPLELVEFIENLAKK